MLIFAISSGDSFFAGLSFLSFFAVAALLCAAGGAWLGPATATELCAALALARGRLPEAPALPEGPAGAADGCGTWLLLDGPGCGATLGLFTGAGRATVVPRAPPAVGRACAGDEDVAAGAGVGTGAGAEAAAGVDSAPCAAPALRRTPPPGGRKSPPCAGSGDAGRGTARSLPLELDALLPFVVGADGGGAAPLDGPGCGAASVLFTAAGRPTVVPRTPPPDRKSVV